MFHFSAVCFIERYAIIVLLVSQKGIISRILLYSKLRGKSILLAPSGAQYFVHLGLFPLILANWQAGCAGALSGISIPKTCWDNPNPLSIIAGDGYAFLRNAIQKKTPDSSQVGHYPVTIICPLLVSFFDFLHLNDHQRKG